MMPSELSRRALLKQGGAAIAALSVLRLAGPAPAFPDARRRGGHPLAGPARAQPRPGGDRPATRLGGAGLLAHADRPVLRHQALRPARPERGGLAAGDRRPGRPARDPDAGRPQGAPAPGGHLHPGVLRQPRPSPSSPAASATPPGRARRSPPLLEEAGVLADGHEVVFWGADAGEQTWRESDRHRAVRPQHVAGGRAGPGHPARLRDERRAAAARARLPGCG